jgi:hypothetical protein
MLLRGFSLGSRYRSALSATPESRSQGEAKERARRHIRKGGHDVIIAVDFDGILCKNKFPDIGAPEHDMILMIKQLMDQDHEVILWTSRTEQELENAVEWCKNHGLYFTAINDNAPSNKEKYEHIYPNGTRKVYADIYIDDHNLDCQMYEHCYTHEMMIKHIIDSLKEVIKWEMEN